MHHSGKWLKMSLIPLNIERSLRSPSLSSITEWWPTLLIEVSERLGHAWNLCLFRQTVKKKVEQTYVTGATGQGPPMWQVAAGSRLYSWCYLPRCPPSLPSLSLPLSRSLGVCSALSKHVTGMPRLRDVSVCVCGREQKQRHMEWNGMEWIGLDWVQTVQDEEEKESGQRGRWTWSWRWRRVTFAAGNGNGGSAGAGAAAAYNGNANGNGNSTKCLHGRRCGSSANICVTCLTKKWKLKAPAWKIKWKPPAALAIYSRVWSGKGDEATHKSNRTVHK